MAMDLPPPPKRPAGGATSCSKLARQTHDRYGLRAAYVASSITCTTSGPARKAPETSAPGCQRQTGGFAGAFHGVMAVVGTLQGRRTEKARHLKPGVSKRDNSQNAVHWTVQLWPSRRERSNPQI